MYEPARATLFGAARTAVVPAARFLRLRPVKGVQRLLRTSTSAGHKSRAPHRANAEGLARAPNPHGPILVSRPLSPHGRAALGNLAY